MMGMRERVRVMMMVVVEVELGIRPMVVRVVHVQVRRVMCRRRRGRSGRWRRVHVRGGRQGLVRMRVGMVLGVVGVVMMGRDVEGVELVGGAAGLLHGMVEEGIVGEEVGCVGVQRRAGKPGGATEARVTEAGAMLVLVLVLVLMLMLVLLMVMVMEG
jgi:hypothetical protein